MKKLTLVTAALFAGIISTCASEPSYYDDYDYGYFNGYGVGYDNDLGDDWFYDYYDYSYEDDLYDSYYDYDYDNDVFGWEEYDLF